MREFTKGAVPLSPRVLFCRQGKSFGQDVIITFRSVDDALYAVAQNEHVKAFFPLSSSGMVRPRIATLDGGWIDATTPYMAHRLRYHNPLHELEDELSQLLGR